MSTIIREWYIQTGRINVSITIDTILPKGIRYVSVELSKMIHMIVPI